MSVQALWHTARSFKQGGRESPHQDRTSSSANIQRPLFPLFFFLDSCPLMAEILYASKARKLLDGPALRIKESRTGRSHCLLTFCDLERLLEVFCMCFGDSRRQFWCCCCTENDPGIQSWFSQALGIEESRITGRRSSRPIRKLQRLEIS